MSTKKEKKQFPNNFQTMLGFFMIPFTSTMGAMGVSYFGMFLTDFAGIDTAMGKTGFAAGFATIFLIITRIIDAVDDPLQGWILDSAKERKFGKYRMFGLIGITMSTVGIVMLYGLPHFAKSNAVILWIWVLIGYLILETGGAMGGVTTPLMQKATTNAQTRSKIAASIRLGCVIAAIPFLFYVTMITLIGKAVGNLGKAASVTTILFCLVFCGISLIGILLVKERFHAHINEEHQEKIGLKEIIALLKMNKPLWAHCVGLFIGGLATGTSPAYFLRWKFCADITTGEVDLAKFAMYAGIGSVITLVTNFLCPLVLPFVMKVFKAPDKCIRVCYVMVAVCFGGIFVCDMLNILTPVLLYVLFFFAMIPNGMIATLTLMIVTECADYAEYNLGRNMTAMVSSIYNFTVKASSVIGTALPGFLLMMVGYSVDEKTGAYIGELVNLPKMIDGLSVLLGPVPLAFAFIAFLIYKFGYKITPEYRLKMDEELNKRHTAQAEVQE